MKKLFLIFLCGISLFIAGCGALGGSKNRITVKFNGQEHTFEPKVSWARVTQATYSSSPSSQSVFFEMTNLEKKGDRPSADGQFGASFRTQGAEGTNDKSPVKEGEYKAKTSRQDNYNVISSPYIFYGEDGKKQSVKFDEEKLKGNITITSVTEETISGTVDIEDEKGNSIKGGFTAQREK